MCSRWILDRNCEGRPLNLQRCLCEERSASSRYSSGCSSCSASCSQSSTPADCSRILTEYGLGCPRE